MHRSSADVDGNEASMECVGAVPTRMVLEPSSLHSEAHTKMSMQLSDEYKRTKRLVVVLLSYILDADENIFGESFVGGDLHAC